MRTSSIAIVAATLLLLAALPSTAAEPPAAVDAGALRGKVMCGYQGWHFCPGDGANLGWVHWSRDRKQLSPEVVHVELWPDMSEYDPDERYPAPGFTYPDGSPAQLYSAYNATTVLRHFQWMRQYSIDGAWLQRFVVGLPGAPGEREYASRLQVLHNVVAAAEKTGRAWSISYDIAGTPTDRIYDLLTADWKRLVDEERLTRNPRFLHERGLPVVQIWGFYYKNDGNKMTAELGNRLIDFFKAPGPYRAYLVGGGNWDWRRNPDPDWQAMYRRFDAYSPWNVGNTSRDKAGVIHASTGYWADDRREAGRAGMIWLPVVYPGFSWSHLKRQPELLNQIPRRQGKFLWEQFAKLTEMHVDTAYVAMFDEVDEGTAIYKVTNTPPTQTPFVTYDGLPSDWYLRVTGAGAQMLRGQIPPMAEIPIKP